MRQDTPFLVVELPVTDTPDALKVVSMCVDDEKARIAAATFAMQHEGMSYGVFQRIDTAKQERRVEWSGG